MMPDSVNRFWAAVADCLLRFHRFDAEAAERSVQALRERLETELPAGPFHEIYLHEEPWTVASNLAGDEESRLPVDDWMAYQAILKQHGLGPEEDERNSASPH